MPIKTKVSGPIFKKDLIPNISNRFSRDLKDEIGDLIIDEIQSGLSPVGKGGASNEGKGRYRQYSREYAARKGVPRQLVDMTDTGRMLSSLRVKQTKRGTVRVFFSRLKPAIFHDRLGAGRSKILRRLLPSRRGETFKQSILNRIVNILANAVTRETS